MGFESSGYDHFNETSPGGFEFGVIGWVWGPPTPKSITFFLDGSAMVCDQYGRHIRRAVNPTDGTELRFADSAPDASKEGEILPRPQFATHAQVLAALVAERIDWLAYEVRYRDKTGQRRVQAGLTQAAAIKLQTKLLQDGCSAVLAERTIACAGWPQLPYAELKKLPELPPTPESDLRKIRSAELRKDALRARREADEAHAKELSAVDGE